MWDFYHAFLHCSHTYNMCYGHFTPLTCFEAGQPASKTVNRLGSGLVGSTLQQSIAIRLDFRQHALCFHYIHLIPGPFTTCECVCVQVCVIL